MTIGGSSLEWFIPCSIELENPRPVDKLLPLRGIVSSPIRFFGRLTLPWSCGANATSWITMRLRRGMKWVAYGQDEICKT
jgi:hypothetical protein